MELPGLVDAPAALPRSDGEFEITGRDADGAGGGAVRLDEETDRPVTILRNPRTGAVTFLSPIGRGDFLVASSCGRKVYSGDSVPPLPPLFGDKKVAAPGDKKVAAPAVEVSPCE